MEASRSRGAFLFYGGTLSSASVDNEDIVPPKEKAPSLSRDAFCIANHWTLVDQHRFPCAFHDFADDDGGLFFCF